VVPEQLGVIPSAQPCDALIQLKLEISTRFGAEVGVWPTFGLCLGAPADGELTGEAVEPQAASRPDNAKTNVQPLHRRRSISAE
jgi:hypothetical protein